ncbi:hypothetical protein VTN77DRAFT_628 [Rasamsonia byssochlamydoides]|uniref:uncharacterized protein n=1 Tax=Rasamsonia byssochlamydoides TaxID=89139 RepID=UPI003744939C
MSLRILLQRILTVLLPLSIASALYLYLYPVFHGCAFPLPTNGINNDSSASLSFASNAFVKTALQHISLKHGKGRPAPAIFRLLVLADPQLEGDSSLPGPDDEFVPRLRRHWAAITATQRKTDGNLNSGISDEDDDRDISFLSAVQSALRAIILDDIPSALRATRKRLDLFGNDYYLAHIYRTLHWWSRPTHVAVLGDLIGSQWVSDEEFERRGLRYWNRVFRGGERVGDDVTITGKKKRDGDGEQQQQQQRLEMLQRYDSPWARRIINVAGNHDIGYAGDVSEARLERFERVFGRADWDVRFQHPLEDGISSNSNSTTPTLHIINLNDLTLDTPALVQQIQSDSYAYINELITHRSYPVEDRTTFTLLLTHVPLHKREGICTDPPYFSFHEEDDEHGEDGVPRFRSGGLREQNHLSEHVSTNAILQGIFGMSGNEHTAGGGWGRKGLILTGHDHTGCDVVHFVNRSSTTPPPMEDSQQQQSWHWDATRYSPSSSSSLKTSPSIREVTLRSMMGEYGGNAGLLSVWFDADPSVNEWQYEISMCAAGVQHIWWAVHGVALATCIGLIWVAVLSVVHVFLGSGSRSGRGSAKVTPKTMTNGALKYQAQLKKSTSN